MTSPIVQKARTFVYRNARPLELARWQFLFEGGSADAVLRALAVYQNEDGGFGNALEADSWNPDSAPYQAVVAIEVLTEIGCFDPAEPVVARLLDYLASGKDFTGEYWYGAIPSNNEHPHAPWWAWHDDPAGYDDAELDLSFGTPALAAYFLAVASPDHPFCATAQAVASRSTEAFLAGQVTEENALTIAAQALHVAKAGGVSDFFGGEAAWRKLAELAAAAVTPEALAPSAAEYAVRPSWFVPERDEILYPALAELLARESHLITATQEDDGSWPIPWTWEGYESQWPVARNWWKGYHAINNVRCLTTLG